MYNNIKNRIPVVPSLNLFKRWRYNGSKEKLAKKRLFFIALLSVGVAVLISMIAKVLVLLINLVTNISFFGSLSTGFRSPAENNLGWWVILIPAVGGILVGLMALYGSKAIRGHGIPEAMEQVLTNQSKIKPLIAILKPVSSAIAIGTGGPFGAEGPIIATGGALGSTLGQLIRITPAERKVILAAGATAGMSVIFGTPIAAVFLAIELLLFEFSPRAIIPVALACITGAAGHHLLFEAGPVFPMPVINAPSNLALAFYSLIGILIGFIAVGLTKLVYWIEDAFEKLPIHWMWWPALGGLAVGIIGYFEPHTLGVGYDNIIRLLSGNLTFSIILALCIFKFLSWSIALSSGTSGGTLAPLMTIGGATGALLGYLISMVFPDSGISIPVTALVGMSAMFAGASRAYLTSILFALEATNQVNGLLPLLCACSGAYLISFFLMEHTIMTEKIARRGIYTPDSYEPDPLLKLKVKDVLRAQDIKITGTDTIAELKLKLNKLTRTGSFLAITDSDGKYNGTLNLLDVLDSKLDVSQRVLKLCRINAITASPDDNLHKTLMLMSEKGFESLPVMSDTDKSFLGLLTYHEILSSYSMLKQSDGIRGKNLDLSRQRKKMILRGRTLLDTSKNKIKVI